jgi:hypothetical protein
LGGPINGTDDFVVVVILRGSEHGHGGQESGSKLLRSEDGELVNSHFVGLGVVGVVLVDKDDVLLEDKSSVCFLFRGPVDSVLSLPLIEGIELGITGSVVHCQDGERDQRSDQELLLH